jgi:hypothetical protein
MADSLIDDNTPDQTGDRTELLAKWKDKTPQEVLDAKIESDLYIKTLTARMDGIRDDYIKLREENQAKASLEELISRQEKLLANPDTLPPTQENVNQPSLKPEEIDALLEQKLSNRERLTKQTENFNFVKAKLKEQFGDNASTALKQRMDTLGLDQGFTDELAKNHPSVFLKTFGMDEQRRQDDTPLPRNTVRPDRFAPVTQKRDWNYYQELNKRDPRAYLDPKIAIQMHNDAMALGDAFGIPDDREQPLRR